MESESAFFEKQFNDANAELEQLRKQLEIAECKLENIANLSYTELRGAVERYRLDEETKTFRSFATAVEWDTAARVSGYIQKIALDYLSERKKREDNEREARQVAVSNPQTERLKP